MGYEDFVYFLLAEEDKSAEPSLEYWYFWSFVFCYNMSEKSANHLLQIYLTRRVVDLDLSRVSRFFIMLWWSSINTPFPELKLPFMCKRIKREKDYNAKHVSWLLRLQNSRFKCIDLDENGVLTQHEMQFFYAEQIHRLKCMAQEPILFEDILCQIFDMIGVKVIPWFLMMIHLCH